MSHSPSGSPLIDGPSQLAPIEEDFCIDRDRFVNPDDIDPNLFCAINLGVLHKPRRTPCGHVFCRPCLAQWLIRDSHCPQCRSTVKDLKTDRLLSNIIDNIAAKCVWECGFEARYGDIERHERTCASRPASKTADKLSRRPDAITTNRRVTEDGIRTQSPSPSPRATPRDRRLMGRLVLMVALLLTIWCLSDLELPLFNAFRQQTRHRGGRHRRGGREFGEPTNKVAEEAVVPVRQPAVPQIDPTNVAQPPYWQTAQQSAGQCEQDSAVSEEHAECTQRLLTANQQLAVRRESEPLYVDTDPTRGRPGSFGSISLAVAELWKNKLVGGMVIVGCGEHKELQTIQIHTAISISPADDCPQPPTVVTRIAVVALPHSVAFAGGTSDRDASHERGA